MNQKQKEEQYKLFAGAFHEVVVPLLENMATKDDIKDIREDLGDVKDRVYRIEEKLDKIDDRLDRHGKMLDDHARKFEKIGKHIRIASL